MGVFLWNMQSFSIAIAFSMGVLAPLDFGSANLANLAQFWGKWKKIKSWEPFWSYQLNSSADSAHLPQNWAKLAKLAVLFSSKTASRILISSNAIGVNNSLYVKYIATCAPTIFWMYLISLSQCELIKKMMDDVKISSVFTGKSEKGS